MEGSGASFGRLWMPESFVWGHLLVLAVWVGVIVEGSGASFGRLWKPESFVWGHLLVLIV